MPGRPTLRPIPRATIRSRRASRGDPLADTPPPAGCGQDARPISRVRAGRPSCHARGACGPAVPVRRAPGFARRRVSRAPAVP